MGKTRFRMNLAHLGRGRMSAISTAGLRRSAVALFLMLTIFAMVCLVGCAPGCLPKGSRCEEPSQCCTPDCSIDPEEPGKGKICR